MTQVEIEALTQKVQGKTATLKEILQLLEILNKTAAGLEAVLEMQQKQSNMLETAPKQETPEDLQQKILEQTQELQERLTRLEAKGGLTALEAENKGVQERVKTSLLNSAFGTVEVGILAAMLARSAGVDVGMSQEHLLDSIVAVLLAENFIRVLRSFKDVQEIVKTGIEDTVKKYRDSKTHLAEA